MKLSLSGNGRSRTQAPRTKHAPGATGVPVVAVWLLHKMPSVLYIKSEKRVLQTSIHFLSSSLEETEVDISPVRS